MVEKLIQYGLSAAIAAAATLATLFIKRKWEKDDSQSEVIKRLDTLKIKLDAHIESDRAEKIEEKRLKIIEFSDDLCHARSSGVSYSKERFDQVLEYITDYKVYCDLHEKFPNGKAEFAIKNIQKVYEKCMEEQSFLV